MHIFELIAMHVKHRKVYKNLKKGFFPFKRQIKNLHEQNKVIKSTGGQQICSTNVRFIIDSLGNIWPRHCQNHHRVEESEGKPLTKSALSARHHEVNDIFCKNFEFDIKTLSRGLLINPFMSTKLHKINNDSIVVRDFMFERIKYMEDIGETQFKNFVNDGLTLGKKISQ